MQMLERVRAKIAGARKALSAAGDSVEGIREAIRQLEAERAAVANAPVPIGEAREAVEQTVDRLAAAAQYASVPVVLAAAERGQVGHVDLHARDVGSTFGFFADILRPALRDCLVAAVEAHYRDLAPGLPADERAQRLAELDHQLLELSRHEESMITELSTLGLDVSRRGDADPRAVLGLAAE